MKLHQITVLNNCYYWIYVCSLIKRNILNYLILSKIECAKTQPAKSSIIMYKVNFFMKWKYSVETLKNCTEVLKYST